MQEGTSTVASLGTHDPRAGPVPQLAHLAGGALFPQWSLLSTEYGAAPSEFSEWPGWPYESSQPWALLATSGLVGREEPVLTQLPL